MCFFCPKGWEKSLVSETLAGILCLTQWIQYFRLTFCTTLVLADVICVVDISPYYVKFSFSFFLGNLPTLGRESKNRFMHNVICKWYVVPTIALGKVESLVQIFTCSIIIVTHFHIFLYLRC